MHLSFNQIVLEQIPHIVLGGLGICLGLPKRSSLVSLVCFQHQDTHESTEYIVDMLYVCGTCWNQGPEVGPTYHSYTSFQPPEPRGPTSRFENPNLKRN